MATSLTTKGKASNFALVRVIAAWIHKGPSGYFVSISVSDDSFGTDYTSLPLEKDEHASYKLDLNIWDDLVEFIAEQTDAKLAWKALDSEKKSKPEAPKSTSNFSEADLALAAKGEHFISVSKHSILQFLIEEPALSYKTKKGKTYITVSGALCGLSTREHRKGNTLKLG
jgi:hypothetical protein